MTKAQEVMKTAFSAVCLIVGIAGLGMLLTVRACHAQVLPLPKTGQCPSNYSSGASYCTPGQNAKACIQKVGQCPANWSQSGNYCCQM